jgi:hypothetical protein
MKPQTVATRVKDGLLRSAKSSWITAGVLSLGVNMYEYGKTATSPSDFWDKTIENRKFWVSTVVDTALAVAIGVGAAALAVALLPVTATVTTTLVVTAGIAFL